VVLVFSGSISYSIALVENRILSKRPTDGEAIKRVSNQSGSRKGSKICHETEFSRVAMTVAVGGSMIASRENGDISALNSICSSSFLSSVSRNSV
jgi:hypothetical protein